MARPNKQGIDYFPFDVDLDVKWKLLEAKHGIVGFGIAVKMLQKIYKNGYYIEWNEDELLLTSMEVNVDINEVNVIINSIIAYKILVNVDINGIIHLTSSGIQKRYFEATSRRKEILLINELMLTETPVNAYINPAPYGVNAYKSTQSKSNSKSKEEKETKVSKKTDVVENLFQEYAKDDEELLECLRDFREMREPTKKTRLNEKTCKYNLKKLDELSNGNNKIKIEILENSIAGGYTGLFAIKNSSNVKVNNSNKRQAKGERIEEESIFNID